MSDYLKSLIVFLVIWNTVFAVVDHFVSDKVWAMILFGGFAYVYGALKSDLEHLKKAK